MDLWNVLKEAEWTLDVAQYWISTEEQRLKQTHYFPIKGKSSKQFIIVDIKIVNKQQVFNLATVGKVIIT